MTLPCGRSEVQVDSIVTEGARATINYTLVGSVDAKFQAAKAKQPPDAQYAIVGSEAQKKTASAVLTDEKKWILSHE